MRVIICHATYINTESERNRGTLVIINDFTSSSSVLFMRYTNKKVSKKKVKKFLVRVGINIESRGCSLKIDLEKINREINKNGVYWNWNVYSAYSIEI